MNRATSGHDSSSTEMTNIEEARKLIQEYQVATTLEIDDNEDQSYEVVMHGETGFSTGKQNSEREFLQKLAKHCLEEPMVIRSYYIPYGEEISSLWQWNVLPDGTVTRESLTSASELANGADTTTEGAVSGD